jgi:hypothetical protein
VFFLASETCFVKGDFIMPFPKTQVAINALLQIWFIKIGDWATLYGLSSETVKQVKTDAVIYNHLILAGNQFKSETDEFFAYKKQMTEGNPLGTASAYPVVTLLPLPAFEGTPKPGIEARNTELYNFLKKHPNRTAESLADLGITDASKESISPDVLKALGGAKALPDDKVELSFKKQGQKAVRWQMRRGGGDWGNQLDATESPLIDETPSVDGKPEKREYRAIYLKGNKPFGQYSDIFTVVTTP